MHSPLSKEIFYDSKLNGIVNGLKPVDYGVGLQ